MTKQTRLGDKKLTINLRLYLWTLLVVVAIVVGTAAYIYYSPQKLSYSTSRSVTTLTTPQLVSVDVSGRHATIHYFSGPTTLGSATVSLRGTPTLSAHGNKVIKMAIALQYGDAVGGVKRNTEYSVKIQQLLKPGKYKVELTAAQTAGLSAGATAPRTLVTTFKVN